MSVGELADKSGVAPSTVVRLCKNLGFSGFAQFKIGLISLKKGIPAIMPAVSRTDDTHTIFQKVFESSVRTLQDTLEMLDPAVTERVVEMLGKAKSIYFFGVGTSATIAMDAYYRFMRIGLPAFFATDNHIMRVTASQLGPGDVAVAISHCGKTIDTVETLRIARQSGAGTIALTSYAGSPICAYADEALVVYSDEIRYPMEAVSARIAHIAVLDALCVCMSMKDYDNSLKRTQKVLEIFQPLRKENAFE
jgi:RpiR family carbohydrate utilization transcriptional regulator